MLKSRSSHPPDPGAPRRAFSHVAFSLRSEAPRTEQSTHCFSKCRSFGNSSGSPMLTAASEND